MTGSTTACPAEPGLRPLPHLLAQDHLQDQFDTPSPAAIPGVRWDAIHRSTFPHIAAPRYIKRKTGGMTLPRSLAARLRALAPGDEQLGMFLEDLARAARAETGNGYGVCDAEAFAAGLPLEPKRAPQAHMQALVHDFRRRQRQASMIVAGCVAASFVLTLIGIAALANYARQAPADTNSLDKPSGSVLWRQPQDAALPKLILANAVTTPFAGTIVGEEPSRSLTEPATSASAPPNTAPQLIMVQSGRTLELAPLLTQRQARYILVRGLPKEAKLSSGQRNPTGAWLVKEQDVDRLALSPGEAASGDYPVEVYALGASSAPQARQRLVIRVAAGPATASTGGASGTLFNASLAPAPAQPGVAANASPLMTRAMRLLGEGDIAGARLLLMNLAEQGESDAAYELARTFDAEYLTEIGAKGVGPDKTRAVGWYERASETGNAKAAERLKILASLSD